MLHVPPESAALGGGQGSHGVKLAHLVPPRHALELRLCLGESAQLEKRVAAGTVGLERPLTANRIDELEARCGTEPPR